ncbi:MAG: hypothetical protein ACLQF0_05140 [Dissulfurispiraceae bacterium]
MKKEPKEKLVDDLRLERDLRALLKSGIQGKYAMKTQAMNDTEIKLKGIDALNKTLGASAALRFLNLLHREPTDYVEISRRLYEGQTIDEIFKRAKKRRKE